MYYSRIGRNKVSSQRVESCHFDSAFLQHTVGRERNRLKTQDYYANPSYIGVNVKYDGAVAIATKDIFGKLITHEIGDSQQDALMRRVIVEAIPFLEEDNTHSEETFTTYDYRNAGDDYPKLDLQLRNNAFTMVPSEFQKVVDLVAVNMAAKEHFAGVNPWRSILQTPTSDALAGYVMDTADVANVHESFVLLAPLHSKFRRCRLRYVCKFTVVIRALTVEYQQIGRRFG